ncbi:hypothetical protein KC19_12G053900 [Ceratodon purpureus]|uniref:Glutaredoxin-like protein n=1 Tax=Ceratodon purpureus TaxID=3225 RepID=A0A8T0G513_CERPU|nr:hypothetical protein KC19_12G053900 [Ceratodon purpureus]KAG0553986.1 hypothetical protein KC19_12G053900 [Ceratodon purpureus]
MYLSTEIGLRLSRSCMRQHVSLLRMSCSFSTSVAGFGDVRKQVFGAGEVSQGKECPVLTESLSSCKSFSRGLGGRFFSTKSPGYSVVSGNSDEGLLFKEESASEQLERRRLVLYSKPGCCLCDALKEKLHLAFMLGGEHDLSDIELEVRDITTNEEWEKLYQYEIPVLRRLRADASEETIPRFSPRLTVEQLQKKLAAALISKE